MIDYTKDSRYKKCQDCEQMKKDVDVCYCPYQEDINEAKVRIEVCDNCYRERAADI